MVSAHRPHIQPQIHSKQQSASSEPRDLFMNAMYDLGGYLSKAYGDTTLSDQKRDTTNTVALFAIANQLQRIADLAERAAAEQ